MYRAFHSKPGLLIGALPKKISHGWGAPLCVFRWGFVPGMLMLWQCFVGGPAAAQAQAQAQAGNRQDQPADRRTVEAPAIAEDPIDPTQPLKPSFLINVSVENEPEPSGNYVVDASGNILVHIAEMLSPVSVKGQTPVQAAATLAEFLKKFVRTPHVTVSIVSVPRPIAVVGGAVRLPGPTIINRTTTVVDLVSRAEWSEIADLSQVRLIRTQMVNGQESKIIRVLHLDAYMKPDPGKEIDETQNPTLEDKDTIFVPFKSLSGNGVITIAGEVAHPVSAMPLRTNPPMTLREAISLAGGLTANANRKAVSVRHANARAPQIVDIEKADADDPAHNLTLHPDDAIYVEKIQSTAFFNVYGGMFHAGTFPYEKRMTLTQALMEAGGLSSYAKEKEGKVLRHPDDDPGHTKIIAFNWQKILHGKEADIQILPGDSIWIAPGNPPSNAFNFLTALQSLGSVGTFLNTVH